MYTPIFTKSYETFLSSLYIDKMILRQFTQFFDKFYLLLSLFYNKVTSRSLKFPYKPIEFFVNLLDVA
jgi:hypothetical protein